jgi:hypothetical protein
MLAKKGKAFPNEYLSQAEIVSPRKEGFMTKVTSSSTEKKVKSHLSRRIWV